MDYEKFVEQIVNEVYDKLTQISKADSSITKNAMKKTAIIVGDDKKLYSDSLAEQFHVIAYGEQVCNYDIVIVTKLCLRGLTTLAMGIHTTEEEQFILTTLMKGKKVYILEPGIQYKQYKISAPRNLYRQYIEYEEKIKGYGIIIISHINEIFEDKEVTSQVVENKKVAIDLTYKRLISESDLNRLYMQGERVIQIDKNTIITPLANDFIRTYHLKIEYNSD